MRSGLNQFCLSVFLAAVPFVVFGQHDRAPQIVHPDLIETEMRNLDRPTKLEPVFDKAKNETTFFLSGLMVLQEEPGREVKVPGETHSRKVSSSILKMVTYYKAPGKKKAKPGEVILAFNYGNAFGFEFVNHRNLSITADGEKLEYGQMNLIERRDEGFRAYGFIRYWETLEIAVKADAYKKIFGSKSVVLRIGAGSVSLTKDQLKHLRGYFKELE
jgi:hypothetical protein